MTQQEAVAFWFNKAKDEIESAIVMLHAGKYLYTGFMCHQAIEKALKGYYIFLTDERHPQTHNLAKLMEETSLYSKASDKHKETITKLNPLYIDARYEDYKNKTSSLLTKEYTETLLSETEELLEWITEFTN